MPGTGAAVSAVAASAIPEKVRAQKNNAVAESLDMPFSLESK
jgi:hypothetical protein